MPEVSMPPEAASFPDPGERLISRVASGVDRAAFYWSGRESVRELERTLAVAGRTLDSFESILDFGCGCGRMLLWLADVGRSRQLYGTDVDAEAIAWCREHIPYARVSVNDANPPLPYEQGTFDLVFNHSVFTHIDERRQDAWLSELQRVTRPGGLVVVSVHGEPAIPDGALELRNRLERDGIAFLDRTLPRDFPLPDWYQTTYHAPWYVFEHWGRWFEIRAYVPRAALGLQDHVLLERRVQQRRSPRPIAARPQVPDLGATERRVVDALTATRTYRGSERAGRPLARAVRGLVRRALLRAIRPYSAHEDRFDDAVVASITELSRVADYNAAAIERLRNAVEEGEPRAR